MRLPLLVATLALLFAPAASAEDPIVRRIEFEGLHLHTADEVRLKMETREGKPFSRETLNRDIRRLLDTRWFSDVQVAPDGLVIGPDGVTLRLLVPENDLLQEIRFVGNREFSDEDLLTGTHLKLGTYFAPFEVSIDSDRIRDKYLAEGYPFVRVEGAATAGRNGTVLTFTIREGPRVHVSDIEIFGLEQLSASKLEGEMQTKERNFWNLLSPPVYRAEQLEEDIKRLNVYCRLEGYLDARVYVRELVWTADKRAVDIHIEVEEGLRYVVDSVTFEGNKLFSSGELDILLKVRPGSPCALREVYRDRLTLLNKYWEKAYIDADVDEDRKLLPEKGHVALTWRFKEGTKVYVGRIDFYGNHRTREKVLRREMKLLPGEEFNKRHLDTSMDHLKALHYFEPLSLQLINRAWAAARDEIIVVEVTQSAEPDTRDVAVHVQEGRTGNIKIGGSYNDEFGVIGNLEITQNNFDLFDLPKSLADVVSGEAFAGAGQIARINLSPGHRRSVYEVSFTEPWFLDRPVSMSVSADRRDQDVLFYRERRTGLSVDFGRRWDDFERRPETFDLGWASPITHIPGYFFIDDLLVRGLPIRRFWERGVSIGVGYRLNRILISEVDPGSPDDAFDVEGLSYLSSVTFRVTLDRRDSRVFPTRGILTSASYEHAGYPLGGDWDFWKYEFVNKSWSTVWTWKNGGKTVFTTDLRGGFAQEHYYSEELPLFERFYAGGATSIRGFESRTISPKDRDEPIGGNVKVIASAEIHFPILRIPAYGRDVDLLRGAIFTDWGTVVAKARDFGDFRWSVGFGFRLQIPLGPQVVPVLVDFGFPIRKEEGDERQSVHVGFDFGF